MHLICHVKDCDFEAKIVDVWKKKMVLTKQNCYLECSHVVTQSYYLPENVFLIEISN